MAKTDQPDTKDKTPSLFNLKTPFDIDKEKTLENQITYPHCNRTISNNPVIDSAAKGEDKGSTFFICECGEKITFWAITAQLRDQKKPVARIKNWIHKHAQAHV